MNQKQTQARQNAMEVANYIRSLYYEYLVYGYEHDGRACVTVGNSISTGKRMPLQKAIEIIDAVFETRRIGSQYDSPVFAPYAGFEAYETFVEGEPNMVKLTHFATPGYVPETTFYAYGTVNGMDVTIVFSCKIALPKFQMSKRGGHTFASWSMGPFSKEQNISKKTLQIYEIVPYASLSTR